jgi:hypothetical protein
MNINWKDWDIEEKEENGIKISFDLDNKIYPSSFKFNINDRIEVIFKDQSYYATMISNENSYITFEFDDFINGHNGYNNYRKGKKGHCWNYSSYKESDIEWLLNKLESL